VLIDIWSIVTKRLIETSEPIAAPSSSKGWPLRAVVIVPFALLVSLAVFVTTWTSHKGSEAAVGSLIESLLLEVSQKVHTQLSKEMAPPIMAVEANLAAMEDRFISASDPQKLATLFLKQIQAYDLSYLLFGLKDGTHIATGYLRQIPTEHAVSLM
jgi:hypothetical protein